MRPVCSPSAGYDQTSVQELTEAMGLASGGLYHYFGSKQQLLIHICDQLMDPLLDETRALLASSGRARASAPRARAALGGACDRRIATTCWCSSRSAT